MKTNWDIIVIGAGAAGMMAAIEAGKRGRSVLVLEHGRKPGEKIRISGGGRCNFTNAGATAANFYSTNPHFTKSALARYKPNDFVELLEKHAIAWHEKTLGQLFCDESAQQIVDMLLSEMDAVGATLLTRVQVEEVKQAATGFEVHSSEGTFSCASLIIATGGKSIPKMGATGFAYRVAEQFSVPVTETRPALVPFTLEPTLLAELSDLSGVSVEVEITCRKKSFREAMLFTHRGLSGPAVLQISAVWREGDEITIRLLPGTNWPESLKTAKAENGKQALATVLGHHLPKRLAHYLAEKSGVKGNLADVADKALNSLGEQLSAWKIKPAGTEGYRTAEVTLGGIDTAALDSKTMQAKAVPGLYFIGECVDVTGWLGGYNFQWAWASGVAAGQSA